MALAADCRSWGAALFPGSVTIHFSVPPVSFVAAIAAFLLDILEEGVTGITALFPLEA